MPTTANGNYFGFSSIFFSSLHFVPRIFKIKKTFRGLATHTHKIPKSTAQNKIFKGIMTTHNRYKQNKTNLKIASMKNVSW